MNNHEIVIAKFCQGGIEPQNPTHGTVWLNDYEGTVSIYLGDKWFECIMFENTGYTDCQKIKMEEKEKKEKLEEQLELEKYKSFMKNFKELLDDIN